MPNEKTMKCSRCESDNLEPSQLGVVGSQWQVTFRTRFFTKEKLLAYACLDCGLVFLQLASWPGQASDQAKAWADAETRSGNS